MARLLRTIPFTLVLAMAAIGCSQGQGEACETDRDCDDGLVCSVSDLRGTCEAPDTADPNPERPDSGDESTRDASVRDAASGDGSTDDAGSIPSDDDAG